MKQHAPLDLLAPRRLWKVEFVVLNVVPGVGELARVGKVGLAVGQVLDEDQSIRHEARYHANAVDLFLDRNRGLLVVKLVVASLGVGRMDNLRNAAIDECLSVGGELDVLLDAEGTAIGGHHVRLEVQRLDVDGGKALEPVGAHRLDGPLQVGVLFLRTRECIQCAVEAREHSN